MYPQVYHSYRLYQLWAETPNIPYTQPTPPEKPKFRLRGNVGTLLFFIFLFSTNVIVLPIASVASGEQVPSTIWLYSLLWLLIAIAFLIYIHFKYQKPLQEEYESELEKYHSLCKIYNQERDRILSADNVKAYRESEVRKWLSGRENWVSGIPDIRYCNDSDDVKVGKSEMTFYNLMKSNLPYTVRKDIKVPVAQTFYYPDIAVIARGLYIDIEIDEPYTDDEGKPIHYVDFSSDIWDSVDMHRNRFMSKEGWEIIRFAEEQIVNYPQECIAFIKELVDSLLSNGSSEPKIDFPHPVLEWDKEEAERYALEKYRDSYYTNLVDCPKSEANVKSLEIKEREYNAFINWFERQKKYSHNSHLLHPDGWNCFLYEIMVKGRDENGVECDYPFMVCHHSYASRCEDVQALEHHYRGEDYIYTLSIQDDGTIGPGDKMTYYDKNKKYCKYVELCTQDSAADLTSVFDKFVSIIQGVSNSVIVIFPTRINEIGVPEYTDNHLDYLREELCKKDIQFWELWELEYDSSSIDEQQDVVLVEYYTDYSQFKTTCEKVYNNFRAKSPCITYLSVFNSCSSVE